MSRRKSRELAFILLFEQSFAPGDRGEIAMDEIIECAKEAWDVEPDAFACSLARGAAEHRAQLDGQIEARSRRWKKDRLSRVTLALLRLALYEMQYEEETPASVAINEAVELAKKYGDEEEYAFVNGVLGSVAREMGNTPQKAET